MDILQEHAAVLGISLPTEARLLKSAFRRQAMFRHPDRGGNADAFRELEEAYRVLSEHPEILVSGSYLITKTVAGIPLTDLGKGYPLSVSARACENCEGRGYRILREPRFGTCDACHGDGWKHLKCNRCNGVKFQENGDPCPSCNGSGEFVPHDYAVRKGLKPRRTAWSFSRQWPDNHYCDVCRGDGGCMKKDGEEYAVTCDECKGVGEIKLFNPVLPRGLLKRGTDDTRGTSQTNQGSR